MGMVPNRDEALALIKKYSPNEEYETYVREHGEIVAAIALDTVDRNNLNVDKNVLKAACLLHDVGSSVFVGAERADADFKKIYPGHAIFSAKILQDEGVDERVWRAVETHVLLGLSGDEIAAQGFALPARDYYPKSLEARLVCYADRFHSKHPTFNEYESFVGQLHKDFPQQAEKFEQMVAEFGLPDIEPLVNKYKHPVR